MSAHYEKSCVSVEFGSLKSWDGEKPYVEQEQPEGELPLLKKGPPSPGSSRIMCPR